jgi:hypothetical protein
MRHFKAQMSSIRLIQSSHRNKILFVKRIIGMSPKNKKKRPRVVGRFSSTYLNRIIPGLLVVRTPCGAWLS